MSKLIIILGTLLTLNSFAKDANIPSAKDNRVYHCYSKNVQGETFIEISIFLRGDEYTGRYGAIARTGAVGKEKKAPKETYGYGRVKRRILQQEDLKAKGLLSSLHGRSPTSYSVWEYTLDDTNAYNWILAEDNEGNEIFRTLLMGYYSLPCDSSKD